MNTHIDTLAEWWENAEDAPASPGDRIIERHVCERDEDTYYTIGVHHEGMRGLIGKSGTRILSRAPKPKPAWHNAPVVSAATKEHPEFRDIWVSDCGEWRNVDGNFIDADDFLGVTPLIEAKVTDEMLRRAVEASKKWEFGGISENAARAMLTAALGLEAT